MTISRGVKTIGEQASLMRERLMEGNLFVDDELFHDVLVVGGTHGDEPSGIDLVRHLRRHPRNGVKTLLANLAAIERGVRFVESDLNRSFGRANSATLEERRALRINSAVRGRYVYVIDVHNARVAGMSCLITSEELGIKETAIARHFRLCHALWMPGTGSLIGTIALPPTCGVGIEISQNEMVIFNTEFLADQVGKLASGTLENQNASLRAWKRVAKKMSRTHLLICGVEIRDLRNFEFLTAEQKERIGLEAQRNIAPIFVGETSYGPDFGCHLVEAT